MRSGKLRVRPIEKPNERSLMLKLSSFELPLPVFVEFDPRFTAPWNISLGSLLLFVLLDAVKALTSDMVKSVAVDMNAGSESLPGSRCFILSAISETVSIAEYTTLAGS